LNRTSATSNDNIAVNEEDYTDTEAYEEEDEDEEAEKQLNQQ
jgi:hypothetical protein